MILHTSATGLRAHPTNDFLAARPDRLVTDTLCEPSEDRLEVKYLVSVSRRPEDAVGKKSTYCLWRDSDGQVR